MRHCPKCSETIEESDRFCRSCGVELEGYEGNASPAREIPWSRHSSTEEAPPQYLVLCIVALLFCCSIGGIIALIYNSKIDGLVAQGRMEEAWKASRTAKIWLIVSLVTGLVLIPIYILAKINA